MPHAPRKIASARTKLVEIESIIERHGGSELLQISATAIEQKLTLDSEYERLPGKIRIYPEAVGDL